MHNGSSSPDWDASPKLFQGFARRLRGGARPYPVEPTASSCHSGCADLPLVPLKPTRASRNGPQHGYTVEDTDSWIYTWLATFISSKHTRSIQRMGMDQHVSISVHLSCRLEFESAHCCTLLLYWPKSKIFIAHRSIMFMLNHIRIFGILNPHWYAF